MPSKTIEDFAYQVRDYMRSAEVVEGKNLCFASLVQGVISGGDGSYIPDRTANVCITDFIPITAGVSYVLSCTTSISGKTCLFSPQFYSGASEASYISGLSWTDSGASFTTITGATHLRFSIKLNDSSNFTPSSISNLMLCTEAEWTKSYTYEPYYVPVKDRPTKISGNISFETGISLAFPGDIPLKKEWDICMLSITLVGITATQGTWVNIGTVPEEFTPYKDINGINCLVNSGAHVLDCQIVKATRILRIRDNTGSIANTDMVHFNTTYMAN